MFSTFLGKVLNYHKGNIIFSFMIFFYGKTKSLFENILGECSLLFLEKKNIMIFFYGKTKSLFGEHPQKKQKSPFRRHPQKFFFGALRAPMPTRGPSKTQQYFLYYNPRYVKDININI